MHKLPRYLRKPVSALTGAEIADADLGVASIKHARYVVGDVPYHVVCRTIGGVFLLRPDRRLRLRSIIAGVIGRAQSRFGNVRLYAAVFASNHFHLMMSGPARQFVRFVGFVKGELTRRWRPHLDWDGTLWDRYAATALVTEQAQVRCLEYILSHSVKEDIVGRPQQWPGLHCAAALADGEQLVGEWFDGTRYGKKRHKALERGGLAAANAIDRAAYFERYSVTFSPIPAWADLSATAYRSAVKEVVDGLVARWRASRRARKQKLVGLERLFRTPRRARGPRLQVPWYEERRRMIVWDDLANAAVRGYLDGYWDFQRSFHVASERYRSGEMAAVFPLHAFRPPVAPRALAA
jgi:REP element-mobilizing transposase RayT